MKIHPAVRILLLVSFAVAIQLMDGAKVAGASSILLCLLFWKGWMKFIRLVKRAQWLLLSMALIYAFSTPGEFISYLPEIVAPTYEGLQSGVVQAARLSCMLAALALLLSTTDRAAMISGIYYLLNPFKWVGVNASKFSARLWLTLHYIENMPPGVIERLRANDWNLSSSMNKDEKLESIQLDCPAMTILDVCCLAIIPLMLLVLA